MKAESDTLDTQTSVHRADFDEYKVNLQEGLEKNIGRSKMDESTVIDKTEKEIHSYQEALLKRLQVLTGQEDTIRNNLKDETELIDSLNISQKNISSALKADQKKNKPIITKLNGELKGLEDKLDNIRKIISGIGSEAKSVTGDSLRQMTAFAMGQLKNNVKELEARLYPNPKELK